MVDHRYLRPIKGQRRQGMLETPFPKRETLEVWQGENATVYPLREIPEEDLLFGRGGVTDCAGSYVALSAIEGRVQFAYPCETPQFRDEKVVYCGYLVDQWGHFLVEGVARLWYFLENDPTIDKYVFFVEEGCPREIGGNYRAFLELLGIWDKLEIIHQPTTFREVLVPELGYQCHRYYSDQFLHIFDRVAEAVVPDPSWVPVEKIYYSRSQLKKYGGELDEFGYELMDDFFARNGYTALYPEKLSLEQMIFYTRNCQVIATYSGSVQHNVLFARPGQTMEVLERCVVNDEHQVDVDRLRDLNATYIDVNIPLYTVDFGGPFIMGYNDNLRRFAEDRGYCPPDPKFLTEGYRRRCFASYMRSYWNQYRYRWFMLGWYDTCTDVLWEGYQAGYACFQEYLDGEKPFFWYQNFQIHYVKQMAKRVLRKLGLYHG